MFAGLRQLFREGVEWKEIGSQDGTVEDAGPGQKKEHSLHREGWIAGLAAGRGLMTVQRNGRQSSLEFAGI